ncbi:hypothetical protein RDI58_024622 [Solanum bulbocastanum]|uniref:Uncharacterized protein n=1 Tax=Solanum bulbocastanum TaxID=147425 RepID=A0AAN8T1M2_SOLBU
MEPGSLNSSSNVVEEIRNEIDKERIRKDIIVKEVARKQMLEFEVQRAMGMGVFDVSRHDMDHFSEVPFRHHVVEPIISTVNQSPKVEILQVKPPGIRGLLLGQNKPKGKEITVLSRKDNNVLNREDLNQMQPMEVTNYGSHENEFGGGRDNVGEDNYVGITTISKYALSMASKKNDMSS